MKSGNVFRAGALVCIAAAAATTATLSGCGNREKELRAAVELRYRLYAGSQDSVSVNKIWVDKLKDGAAFPRDPFGQGRRIEKSKKEFIKQNAQDSFGSIPGLNWDEVYETNKVGNCEVALTLNDYPRKGQSLVMNQALQYIWLPKKKRWMYWDRKFTGESVR